MTRQSDALRDRLKHYVAGTVIDLATETKDLLVETTPVDTGAARDGWDILPGPVGELRVVNDEKHIRFLNEGSSEQAPAGFVETARAQAIINVRARGRVRARSVQVSAPGLRGRR